MIKPLNQSLEVVTQTDQYIIIDNIIPDIDKYDINSWFSDSRGTFSFPKHHSNFKLNQYKASEEIKQIGEVIQSKLALLFDIPPNTNLSSGAHEIRMHKEGTGGIPPHADVGHFCGITIFVNREWNECWGGWNYVMNGDDIIINTPKFNRAVIIFSGTLHGCIPVWEDRVRRTLQYFITYEKD